MNIMQKIGVEILSYILVLIDFNCKFKLADGGNGLW